VKKAVANVLEVIAPEVQGMAVTEQAAIYRKMLASGWDGGEVAAWC